MWFEGMGYREALQGLWRAALGVLGAFLGVLCLAGLFAASAWPRMHAGPGVMDGGRRLGGAGAAPLDGFTDPSGAYSFRKLKSTYTGPAIRIRRASDNAETDINFLGFTSFTGAPWDAAAAASHCAATNCFVKTVYDQSGNARDWTQTTAANQPQLIFNCNGSLPCWQTTLSTQTLLGASYTPSSTNITLNAVASRAVGTTSGPILIRINGSNDRLLMTAANTWSAGPGVFNAAAADAVWHSAIAVLSTTAGASVLNIDGAETTGTTAPVLTAGAQGVVGTTGDTVNQSEAIFWDGYTLTPAERAALIANQRSYGLIP